MVSSKILLLYYKNIVDRCFLSYIDRNQNNFVKNDLGQYVLSVPVNRKTLIEEFTRIIIHEIRRYSNGFDILRPEYLFIIGGCDPKCNILLAHKKKYFPEKLGRLISSDRNIKYLLKEKDIIVDIDVFNQVFIDIFNNMFLHRNRFTAMLHMKLNNVFMLRHNELDCYAIFKVMKFLYGKSNCVNLYNQYYKEDRKCFVAVNDLIDTYTNKNELNGSITFKKAVNQIREYTESCIAEVNSDV